MIKAYILEVINRHLENGDMYILSFNVTNFKGLQNVLSILNLLKRVVGVTYCKFQPAIEGPATFNKAAAEMIAVPC